MSKKVIDSSDPQIEGIKPVATIKLSDIMRDSSTTNEPYNPAGEFVGHHETLGKYDTGLHPELSQQDVRAANQGMFKTLLNSGVQLVTGTLADLVSTPGYMSAATEGIEEMEEGFSGAFIDAGDWLREFGQELAPIHMSQQSQQTVFDPLNSEWWGNSIAQFGPTVAMLVASYASAGLATPAMMSRFANVGGRMGKMARAYARGGKGVQLAQASQMAFTSRLIESGMEAHENFQSMYQSLLNEGVSEQEAKMKAGDQARDTWWNNWALLAVDFLQYNSILKGLGKAHPSLSPAFGTSLGVLANMGSEAMEEGYQFAVSKASEARLRESEGSKDEDTTVLGNFFKHLGDTEMQQVMVQGALGGAVFSGLGALGEKVKSRMFQIENQHRQIQEAKQQNNTNAVESLHSNITKDMMLEYADRGELNILKSQLQKDSQDTTKSETERQTAQKALEYIDFYENFTGSIDPNISDDIKRAKFNAAFDQKISSENIQNFDSQLGTHQSTMNTELKNGTAASQKITKAKLKALKEFKPKTDTEKKVKADLEAEFNNDLDPEFKGKLGKTSVDIPAGNSAANYVRARIDNMLANAQAEKLDTKKGQEEFQVQENKRKEKLEKDQKKKEAQALEAEELQQKKDEAQAEDNKDEAKFLAQEIKERREKELEGQTEPQLEYENGKVKNFQEILDFYVDKPFAMGERFDGVTSIAELYEFLESGKKAQQPQEEVAEEEDITDEIPPINVQETVEQQAEREQAEEQKASEDVDNKDTIPPPPKNEEIEQQPINRTEKVTGKSFIKTFDMAMYQVETKNDVQGIYLTNYPGGWLSMEEAQKRFKINQNAAEGQYYTLLDLNGHPIPSPFTEEFGIDREFVRTIDEHKDKEVTLEFNEELSNAYKKKSGKNVTANNAVIQAVMYIDGERKVIGVLGSTKDSKSTLGKIRSHIFDNNAKLTTKIDYIRGGDFWNISNMESRQTAKDFIKQTKLPLILGVGYQRGVGGGVTLITNNIDQEIELVKDVKIETGVTYMFVKDLSGKYVPYRTFSKTVEEFPNLKEELLKAIATFNVDKARSITRFTHTDKKGKRHLMPDFRSNLQDFFGKTTIPKHHTYDVGGETKTTKRAEYLVPGALLRLKVNDTQWENYRLIEQGADDTKWKVQQVDDSLEPIDKPIDADWTSAINAGSLYVHYAQNYFNTYKLGEKQLQVDNNKINIEEGYNESVADRFEVNLNQDQQFHSPGIALRMDFEISQKQVVEKKPKKTVDEIKAGEKGDTVIVDIKGRPQVPDYKGEATIETITQFREFEEKTADWTGPLIYEYVVRITFNGVPTSVRVIGSEIVSNVTEDKSEPIDGKTWIQFTVDGVVDKKVLLSIVNKVKNNESLSPREQEIYESITDAIDKLEEVDNRTTEMTDDAQEITKDSAELNANKKGYSPLARAMNWGPILAWGKPISFEGFTNEFYLVRDTGQSRRWVIVEGESGMSIGVYENTQQKALNAAKEVLSKQSQEKLDKLFSVPRVQATKKAVQEFKSKNALFESKPEPKGKVIKVENFKITKGEDGAYYYKSGEVVTDERTLNKIAVKETYDPKRKVDIDNKSYYILDDGRIISLNPTTKGREVYKKPSGARNKIVKTFVKQQESFKPAVKKAKPIESVEEKQQTELDALRTARAEAKQKQTAKDKEVESISESAVRAEIDKLSVVEKMEIERAYEEEKADPKFPDDDNSTQDKFVLNQVVRRNSKRPFNKKLRKILAKITKALLALFMIVNIQFGTTSFISPTSSMIKTEYFTKQINGDIVFADSIPGKPYYNDFSYDAKKVFSYHETKKTGTPYIIVDKRNALVHIIDGNNDLISSQVGVTGSAIGDDIILPSVPWSKLDKKEQEFFGSPYRYKDAFQSPKVTPAGKFELIAKTSEENLKKYGFAKVFTLKGTGTGSGITAFHPSVQTPSRIRAEASPEIDDNRITFGCVSLNREKWSKFIEPHFQDVEKSLIYVLPDYGEIDPTADPVDQINVKTFPVNEILNKLAGEVKYRHNEFGDDYVKWNREQETAWFKKNLSNTPLYVLENLAEIGSPASWGAFYNAAVYIHQNAETGTAFHEAFHAIFTLGLSQTQQEAILDQAAKRYSRQTIDKKMNSIFEGPYDGEYLLKGTKNLLSEEEAYDLALEELLADDFMRYVDADMKVSKSFLESLGDIIIDGFKRLYYLVKGALTDKITIDELFYKGNHGYFTSMKNSQVTEQVGIKQRIPDGFTPSEYAQSIDVAVSILDETILRHAELNDYSLTDKRLYKELVSPDPDTNLLLSMDVDYSLVRKLIDHVDKLDAEGNLTPQLEKDFAKLLAGIKSGDNPGVLYEPIVRALSSRGIIINLEKKVVNVENVGQDELAEGKPAVEDQDFREGWQIKTMSVSALEALGEKIRFEFAKTPQMIWNNDQPEIVKGFLGFDKKRSVGWMYRQMQRAIGNSTSSEHMMSKLKQAAKVTPEFKHWLDKIKEDPSLQTQLWVHIGQVNHPEFVTVLQDSKNKSRVIPSNENTLTNNLTNTLISSYLNTSTTLDANGNVMQKKATDLKKGWNRFKDKAKAKLKSKKYSFTNNEIGELFELLNDTGLSMPLEILEAKMLKNNKKLVEYFAGQTGKKRNIYDFTDNLNEDPLAGTGHRNIRSLVQQFKDAYDINTQDAHKNPTGGRVYEWIRANFAAKLINKLKDPTIGKDLIENVYHQDTFFKHSPLLKRLLKEYNKASGFLDKMQYTILTATKLKGLSMSKEYRDLSKRELYITLLSMYYNSGNSDGTAIIPLPVGSNAAMMAGIRIPISKDTDVIQRQLLDVAYQELVRVRQSDDVAIDNRSDHKDKFHFFDNLNDKLETLKKLNLNDKKDQQKIDKILKEGVRQKMNSVYKEEINTLKELDIIGVAKNDKSLFFKDKLFDQKLPESLLKHFVLNNMLYYTQFATLFNGDISYYKNVTDFYKRAKQIWSPGTYLDTNAKYKDIGVRETYNVKYKSDAYVRAEGFIKSVETAAGASIANKYKGGKGSNESDGQSYIDLYRYREQQIGLDRWDDNKQDAYDELMQGNFNIKDVDTVFNANKPFYFNLHTDENVPGRLFPVQNKDSEFVVLPMYGIETFENSDPNPLFNTEYKAILEDMGYTFDGANITFDEQGRNSGKHTDKVVFISGIKAGGFNVDKDYHHKFSNAEWRLQMETPVHHVNDDVIFSVQVRKHMINDLNMEATYTLPDGTTMTGKQLFTEYNNTIIKDIDAGLTKARDRFEDFDSLIQLLREEVIKRGLGEQYLQALEIVDWKDGKVNTALPLYHPLHLYRVEAMLNSILTKNVIRSKLSSGGTFINVSSYGFKKKPEVKFSDDGKSIEYLECYAPVYDSRLYKYMDENGIIDVKKVEADDANLLRGMVWRIPNEDKYSTFNIKIIGFLPKESGGAIVLPSQITDIAGLDFDIDKVYGFFYSSRSRPRNELKLTQLALSIMNSQVEGGKMGNYLDYVRDFTKTFYNRFDRLDQLRTVIENADLEDSNVTVEEILEVFDTLDKQQIKLLNKIRYTRGAENIRNVFPDKDFEIMAAIKTAITAYSAAIKEQYPNLEFAKNKLKNLEGLSDEFYNMLDELTKLKGDTVLETIPSNEDSKKGRDNRKMDLMRAVMESEHTVKPFLTPGGYDTLTKNNETIIEKQKIDIEGGNIGTASTWVQTASRILTGDKLIGIAANANAAHAIFQHAENLQIRKGFKFDGNDYTDLTVTSTFVKKDFVTRVISETLAAFVDNGKDPQAEYANINSITVNVAMSMALLGMDLNTIQFYLSQPIIKEYVQTVLNYGGTAQAELKAKSLMFNKFGKPLNIDKNSKVANFNTPDLLERLNTKKYDDFDFDLLSSFLVYAKRSQPISALVLAIKTAEGGLGPSDSHSIQRIDQIDDDYSDIIGANQLLKDPLLFTTALNSAFKQSRQLLIDHANMPDTNTGAYWILRKLFDTFKPDSFLTVSQINFINSNFLDYLNTANDFYKYDNDITNNLAKRLLEYKNNNKKSDYAPLIDRLSVHHDVNTNLYYIIYNGISGQDKSIIDTIRSTWYSMLIDGKAEEKKLAKDLIKYTFAISGFRVTPSSFSHLQPVEFFISQAEAQEDLEQMIEYAEEVSDFNDPDYKVFVDRFYHQFIRNHFRTLSYIPNVEWQSGNDNVTKVHFTKDGPYAIEVDHLTMGHGKDGQFPMYIKYTHNTKDYLFIKDPMTEKRAKTGYPLEVTYKVIELLGTYKKDGNIRGKMFTEYNINDDLMESNFVQDTKKTMIDAYDSNIKPDGKNMQSENEETEDNVIDNLTCNTD